MPTGPSSSATPFLISEPNVRFVSVVTTGDLLPGDDGVFGGIPDGIGAYDNGDGTITVLVNHEIAGTGGLVRDHGGTGAYVDRIVINKETLTVVSSDDLIKSVFIWDTGTSSYVAGAGTQLNFSRFCSGNLAEQSAFSNGGVGTLNRIYMTGEESGVEGRPTATIVTGSAAGTLYELSYLGNMAYENVVANPFAQNKTIVALTDDGQNGQVYIYVGNKQSTGTDIEKAGLVDGQFYGIKATVTDESNGTPVNGTFTLQEIGPSGNVSAMNGAAIDAESELEGVTSFLRPEDFAWDPDHPNVAYFTTTNAFSTDPATTPTRLYRITFTDVTNPLAGGTIEAVIDGTEGYDAHMFDNLTVGHGKVILQEDPGNQGYLAKVWEYDIATDKLSQVGMFDPAKFAPGATDFLTQDEESSGVLDVTSMLGDSDTRAYLLDAQIHKSTGSPATVEMGQLLVMYVDDPFLIGGSNADNLFGSGADETLRGNAGDDTANAGSGSDQLFGGKGNDVLLGGAGDDQLFGEAGQDTLVGGANDDTQSGGTGDDTFLIDNSVESGFDQIIDFSGSDRLLTSVALSTDGNGIIDFGADKELDLFGSSELSISNKGHTLDELRFQGTVIIDGTTYYSYGLGNGNGGQGGGHASSAVETHLHLLNARADFDLV